MSDYCLYVFVNTNLESMNPGKAMAQSSHCANAFVKRHYLDNMLGLDADNTELDAVEEWMNSTNDGFGTQSNLKSDDFFGDMGKLLTWANYNGYVAGKIIDPTYPFEVSKEIAALLDESKIIEKIERSDKVIVTRPETTAFYVFGDREDEKFRTVMRKYKRHP